MYSGFMYLISQYKNCLSTEHDGATLLHECVGKDITKVLHKRFKEKLMRWDLKVLYVPANSWGGTDALSRYGVSDHNDEKFNGISLLSES